jgi:hypothetical protein
MTTDRTETARRIADLLKGDRFPTGDLAVFRRWRQHDILAPAFYRFVAEHISADLRHPSNERKWAVFVHFAALLVAAGDKEPLSIGRALAATVYHERRLGRLLADTDFNTALEPVVRWLTIKRQPMRMTELLNAIWFNGSNTTRESIARDYYYSLNNNQET